MAKHLRFNRFFAAFLVLCMLFSLVGCTSTPEEGSITAAATHKPLFEPSPSPTSSPDDSGDEAEGSELSPMDRIGGIFDAVTGFFASGAPEESPAPDASSPAPSPSAPTTAAPGPASTPPAAVATPVPTIAPQTPQYTAPAATPYVEEPAQSEDYTLSGTSLWDDFLLSGAYLDDWDMPQDPPTEYATIDIDGDGEDELIVGGMNRSGAYYYLAFGIDAETGAPLLLEVEDSFGNTATCFGSPRYSTQYNALVTSTVQPSEINGGEVCFYEKSGDALVLSFAVTWYPEQGNLSCYKNDDPISADERDEYISTYIYLDFYDLP